jgi:hypothetical protein
VSKRQALAAAFRACNDSVEGRLKTRNVHSEIVFCLSPNNNVSLSSIGHSLGFACSRVVVVSLYRGTATSRYSSRLGRHGMLASTLLPSLATGQNGQRICTVCSPHEHGDQCYYRFLSCDCFRIESPRKQKILQVARVDRRLSLLSESCDCRRFEGIMNSNKSYYSRSSCLTQERLFYWLPFSQERRSPISVSQRSPPPILLTPLTASTNTLPDRRILPPLRRAAHISLHPCYQSHHPNIPLLP